MDNAETEEIRDFWDRVADDWQVQIGETGDSNRRLNSDPVLWAFAGDVRGLRVLDAGCGVGYLSRQLSDRGAVVTGVDISARMIAIARSRHPDVDFRLGSCSHLGLVGASVPDLAVFDLVIANYVLMDTPDLEGAMQAFSRVLRAAGRAILVFSHPCFPQARAAVSADGREATYQWVFPYFVRRKCVDPPWKHFTSEFIWFHRPLSDYWKAFKAAGFSVLDFEEPRITEDRHHLAASPSQLANARNRPYSVAFNLALATVAAALAQSASGWHIIRTYPLGGDGAWDYVVPDPPSQRVYIARQNRVMVVDENSGALLGEVTGIQGAHGTAIAQASGHGFATSGNDQSVVMFDLRNFKSLSRIPAAEDADAIVFDPPSNRVFTLNGDAHSSTVIDAAAGKLIVNLPLGGKPEYGASAGDGKVYANLTDTSEVVEIDAKTATVTRRWPTAPCKQPVSMALDTAHRRLFSGCRSGVMAISDYQSGRVVATVPIGAGVDGAGYDPAAGDAFASNADGTLTVIHQDSPDQYRVAATVTTPQGSRNMGLDPTTHRIFTAAAKFGPPPGGRGRPPVLPDSFSVLVIGREPAAR